MQFTQYENRFSDYLYEHLLANDMTRFWKWWSAKTCKNVMSVSCVDGKQDNEGIANIFKDKFISISSVCQDLSLIHI